MFTDTQIKALSAPLDRSHVATRSQSGRSLSYIEGWHAIAEANRIFGFAAWSRETLEMRLVAERERTIGKPPYEKPGWSVSYLAKVRISVIDPDGHAVERDGFGTGHGIDADLGLAHESACKEAETDAMKRALMTFGNPFGLALYDKTQSNVAEVPAKDWAVWAIDFLAKIAATETPAALGKLRDDTAADRAELKAADAILSARVTAAYKARATALAPVQQQQKAA